MLTFLVKCYIVSCFIYIIFYIIISNNYIDKFLFNKDLQYIPINTCDTGEKEKERYILCKIKYHATSKLYYNYYHTIKGKRDLDIKEQQYILKYGCSPYTNKDLENMRVFH